MRFEGDPGGVFALTNAEWRTLVCVCLGSRRLYSLCRTWWRAYPNLILAGHFQDCCVERFGCSDGCGPAQAHRSRGEACCAARRAVEALLEAQFFVAALSAKFETDVLRSHGNHIPKDARDAATYAFWLPDFLGEHVVGHGARERAGLLADVLPYVASRWEMFDWPALQEVQRQYVFLLEAWAGIARDGKAPVFNWGAPIY